MPRILLTLSGCLLLLGSSGCIDVRDFEGNWSGEVVTESAVKAGFDEKVRVEPLSLRNIDLYRLNATLTTSDGQFKDTELKTVDKFANDALSSLTFDGAPLRSYMLYAPLGKDAKDPYCFVSLFSDDHVELRIFRGQDLFGVFVLERPL